MGNSERHVAFPEGFPRGKPILFMSIFDCSKSKVHHIFNQMPHLKPTLRKIRDYENRSFSGQVAKVEGCEKRKIDFHNISVNKSQVMD